MQLEGRDQGSRSNAEGKTIFGMSIGNLPQPRRSLRCLGNSEESAEGSTLADKGVQRRPKAERKAGLSPEATEVPAREVWTPLGSKDENQTPLG